MSKLKMNPKVGKTDLKIVWSKTAKEELKSIFLFIKKDSVEQAKKVKARLLSEIRNLNVFPEKFEKDPLLIDLDGNFRSRAIWSYKIIYEVTSDKIIILKIFHTSLDSQKIVEGI